MQVTGSTNTKIRFSGDSTSNARVMSVQVPACAECHTKSFDCASISSCILNLRFLFRVLSSTFVLASCSWCSTLSKTEELVWRWRCHVSCTQTRCEHLIHCNHCNEIIWSWFNMIQYDSIWFMQAALLGDWKGAVPVSCTCQLRHRRAVPLSHLGSAVDPRKIQMWDHRRSS